MGRYLWESGRDPEFSSGYGRMYYFSAKVELIFAAYPHSVGAQHSRMTATALVKYFSLSPNLNSTPQENHYKEGRGDRSIRPPSLKLVQQSARQKLASPRYRHARRY